MEEQLVSKKIAERLPVSLAAKSATLAALERLEKARKELDEASRELLAALNLQGSASTSVASCRALREAAPGAGPPARTSCCATASRESGAPSHSSARWG